MSGTDPAELSAAVRAVSGVVDVFTAEGALVGIASAVASAVGRDLGRDPVVADDELVAARIGTSAATSTPDVARHVADTLLERAAPEARVKVRVARIS